MDIKRVCVLLSVILMCCSCTETIPVKPFSDPVSVPNYNRCEVELGGYFNEKYGWIKVGKRGVVKLRFTIPQNAFSTNTDTSSRRTIRPSTLSDNRVIFYIDDTTVAAGDITAIEVKDNSENDSIEFKTASSFGKIGYVEQSKRSIVVKLSDGEGSLYSKSDSFPSPSEAWSGFATSNRSTVLLTTDSYRRRTGITEVFTVDTIAANCF